MSGSDSPTSFHGQPWSSWIERIGRDKPLSDEETETRPATSVTRLSAEDIDLYGFCPERDTFYGVVCEICNAIVKPQALIRHMESRHPSGTSNFPAPTTPMVKPPVKTPFCKVSKLKKSQQSSPSQISSGTKINHTSVKRTAEQANASTSLPVSSSPRSPLDAISVQTTNANSVSSVSGINSGNNSNNSNGGTTGTSSNSTSGCSGGSVGGASGGSSGGGSGGGGCGGGGAGGGGGGGSGSGGGGGGGGGGVGSGGSGVGPTVSSSPVKSPGTSSQPRRKRLKTDRSLLKDREYDPDRHCGVWNEETGKPCTRSLTCKAHTVSLRRTVMGRSKTFDKLLAEHRAAKELPCRTPKITVSVSTVTSANNPASSSVAPNTPTSNTESEAPSSPPVLSLPDTYPLPKAVDLLYRCLAPHGSNKPTKLEEDFANEELRSLESSLANSAISSSQTISSTSMMTPISVVLPSLSPLPANEGSPLDTATLIPSTVSTTMSIVPTPLPTSCAQSSVVAVFDGETSVDIDPDSIAAMYSPVYNDNCGKSSQLVMQLPRTNNLVQSPTSRNYQVQASSMSSLSIFEPMEQLELQHTSQINGKRLNHATHASQIALQSKRSKHDYQQDYSTAIQVEATTTSTPYPHFGDITWSNCHPEPLAVSRWLRITSSRKQYNFNIH